MHTFPNANRSPRMDPTPATPRDLSANRRARNLAVTCGVAAAGTLLLRQVVYQNTLDLDLFHQMAVVRAWLLLGKLPVDDVFAFTPTVRPSIHYEWGNGAVAHALTAALGAGGLLALKYALTAVVAHFVVRTARSRGAGWPMICLLAPIAVLLAAQGFTTVRAGLFTLAFIAVVLRMLESDRAGRCAWTLAWLPLCVVWLNIHPGFIVGVAIIGAYWLEQLLRDHKPRWHVLAAAAATLVLVFANPYGWRYPPAIWHALATMRVPPIPEWLPMWKYPDPSVRMAFATSLLLAAYAGWRAGWRRAHGVLPVLMCAIAALQRGRHSDLYALVWFAYVPAWFQATPQGAILDHIWTRFPRVVTALALLIVIACVPFIIAARPLHVRIPAQVDSPSQMGVTLVYPGGAVDYLRGLGFRGNVMTHYNDGSYVMWRLWPAVRIGMDSRNDVGYRYELIDEINNMYQARPGWLDTLGRYGADLILINRQLPLADRIGAETDWHCVYRDDAFELWSRPGLSLPPSDRTGQRIVATIN
jgi:hypothetical protein